MIETALIVAQSDTLGTRLLALGVCLVVGVILILTGIQNVKSRVAEESGRARTVNKLLGRSNTYEGQTAVVVGVLRIVCGIGLIVFGVAFLFVGPFLAR